MYGAQECSAKADHYAQLAREARSIGEHDRLQRLERSYSLLARSAQFTASLDNMSTVANSSADPRSRNIPRNTAAILIGQFSRLLRFIPRRCPKEALPIPNGGLHLCFERQTPEQFDCQLRYP